MLHRPIKFTILIPSRNEEKDIRLATESAIAQNYSNREIICVDDSDDGTKKIISSYKGRGVILVDGRGTGCCQARNLGIKSATGDVIVFLNADTRLESDFLERILEHYQGGCDWLTTGDYSFNQESVYSRVLQCMYIVEELSDPKFNPLTTSGFSVRRDAALAVGMISGGDYPVNFCRDWTLGKKLEKAGYKKIHDQSIVVSHKSPDNLKEYWQVRKTRGLMSAYQPYFFFHRSLLYLFIKFSAKSILAFFHFALLIPAIRFVIKLAKNSPKPFWRDFFPLYYAYFFHILARCVGEWRGWIYIVSFNGRGKYKMVYEKSS